jgi:hypothetical protein
MHLQQGNVLRRQVLFAKKSQFAEAVNSILGAIKHIFEEQFVVEQEMNVSIRCYYNPRTSPENPNHSSIIGE